ncbi:hypothetical protein SAMN05444365_102566 [Micromonospora pattaloongensis]|uniref:YcxB-like C-terminal domain-containing protein n=1 Tax=Micromonospora pattaloongensis TaxID=405436 RepID=A0A1H3KNI1_9ACTN|nr:YcxB family protein [Micromonospora pattaloongensis]SDY53596.1 hypothetical protein SAMN05444365_102566 [Micromonospora pattaloongensis]
MLIRFEAAPDKKLLTGAVRHTMRRSLRTLRATGVLALGLAVVTALLGFRAAAVLPAVVGLGYLLVLPVVLVRRAVGTSWRFCGLPTTYEITAESVRWSTPLADSTIKWDAFARVDPLPGQLVCRLTKVQFVALPTAPLSGEDEHKLVGVLRDRGLMDPVRPDDPDRVPPPSPRAEMKAAKRDERIRRPVP